MNTHLVGMTLMPQMESQSIFVVTVRGRITARGGLKRPHRRNMPG